MNKFLALVDKVIDKIPLHIRDLIQKASMAIAALGVLFAIIYGIKRGLEDAIPGGVQLYENTEDLFYIQRLREENMKREQLIEDVEIDTPGAANIDKRIHPDFQQMGRDTQNRIMGESQEMLRKSTPFEAESPNRYLDETKEPQPIMPGLPQRGDGEKTLPLMDENSEHEIEPREAPSYTNEKEEGVDPMFMDDLNEETRPSGDTNETGPDSSSETMENNQNGGSGGSASPAPGGTQTPFMEIE